MCGLAGVMKHNMGLGYIERFRHLFAVSQLRGDDGAGMIAVPKAQSWNSQIRNVRVRKTTWSSGYLVTTKDFYDTIKGDQSILIGHARQPTKGGSTIDNVHPHRSGDIIMVHNGTMSHVGNTSVPAGESDSKMIAECLRKHGPEYFVQNSFGAYCLIWVDIEKQTLNFLRNGERPLWFCEEKFTSMENSSTEALYWCSEMTMLHLVLSRFAGYSKERFKFRQLPENTHVEYPLAFVGMIPEPKQTVRKKVYAASTYTNYSDDWAFGYGDCWDQGDQSVIPFDAGKGTNATTSHVYTKTTKVGQDNGQYLPQLIGPRGFSYIPPEKRERLVSETSVRSVSYTLAESKRIAMKNAAQNDEKKKAGAAQPTPFSSSDLDDLVLKDSGLVREYVACAPCAWCSEKPLWRNGQPPRIYPLKFTQTRYDYLCEDCVQDPDTRTTLLGVA